MREVLMNVFTAVAVTVVLCLINEGLKQLRVVADGWLDRLSDEAKERDDEMGMRFFDMARNLINTTVYNAVAAMEQTKAKDIREAVKKGITDKKELEILSKDVLYGVKEQLAPDIIEIMNQYVTDLDRYLQDQIESSLLQIKSFSPQLLTASVFETTNSAEKNEPETERADQMNQTVRE